MFEDVTHTLIGDNIIYINKIPSFRIYCAFGLYWDIWMILGHLDYIGTCQSLAFTVNYLLTILIEHLFTPI